MIPGKGHACIKYKFMLLGKDHARNTCKYRYTMMHPGKDHAHSKYKYMLRGRDRAHIECKYLLLETHPQYMSACIISTHNVYKVYGTGSSYYILTDVQNMPPSGQMAIAMRCTSKLRAMQVVRMQMSFTCALFIAEALE